LLIVPSRWKNENIICDSCRKRYAFLSQKNWFTRVEYEKLNTLHRECDFCKTKILDIRDIYEDIDNLSSNRRGYLISPSDLRTLKINILAIKLKGIANIWKTRENVAGYEHFFFLAVHFRVCAYSLAFLPHPVAIGVFFGELAVVIKMFPWKCSHGPSRFPFLVWFIRLRGFIRFHVNME